MTGAADEQVRELLRFTTPSARKVALKYDVPADACLRLSDVLNLLLTESGRPIAKDAFEYLAKHGGGFREPFQPNGRAPKPSLDRLGQSLGGYFVWSRLELAFRENLTDQEVLAVMPHALTTAIWSNAQVPTCGIVHVGQLIEAFDSEEAAVLVRKLSQALDHGSKRISLVRRGAAYRYLRPEVSKAVVAAVPMPVIFERMRGFWEVVDTLGGPRAMEGVRLNISGHLVDSSSAALLAWILSGAHPGAVRGKHYSAQAEATIRALNWGWGGSPTLHGGDPDTTLEDYRHQDAGFWPEALNGINPTDTNAPVLLVHDDGFRMLTLLQRAVEIDSIHPDYLKLIVGVEQTEAGRLLAERMERKQAGRGPIVNMVDMARSKLKKKVEGLGMGECVRWHIDRMLIEASKALTIDPKEAVVAGYGAVGSATARSLRRRGFKVHVFDLRPEAMKQALDDGFAVGDSTREQLDELDRLQKAGTEDEAKAILKKIRKQAFAHGHLAINATPVEAWTREEMSLLPNHAVCANAGTGTNWGPADHEPAAPKWEDGLGSMQRRNADLAGQDIDEGYASRIVYKGLLGYLDPPQGRDMHSEDPNESIDEQGLRWTSFKGLTICCGDVLGRESNFHYVVRDGEEERLVLYGGSVVNLKWGLPPELVQITYALRYGAGLVGLKARTCDPPRWHEIPDEWQKLIYEIIDRHLKSMGSSLMEPDFDKTPPITAT